MSAPKTTIDLPFSPEEVRMGTHLGNAIAGYRDGDFKRSAAGVVEAVRAFQAASDGIDRLRAENEQLRQHPHGCDLIEALADLKSAKDEIERLRAQTQWHTAPKDGTDILLGCVGEDRGNTYLMAWWDEDSDYQTHPWVSEGERYHQDLPTHWTPLPELPEAK